MIGNGAATPVSLVNFSIGLQTYKSKCVFSLCFTPAFCRVKGLRRGKIQAKCRTTPKIALSVPITSNISLIAYGIQYKQYSVLLGGLRRLKNTRTFLCKEKF
jgi:hypothetical protein